MKILDKLQCYETLKLGCVLPNRSSWAIWGNYLGMLCSDRLCEQCRHCLFPVLLAYTCNLIRKSSVNSTFYTCVVNKNFLASKMKQSAYLIDTDLSY